MHVVSEWTNEQEVRVVVLVAHGIVLPLCRPLVHLLLLWGQDSGEPLNALDA